VTADEGVCSGRGSLRLEVKLNKSVKFIEYLIHYFHNILNIYLNIDEVNYKFKQNNLIHATKVKEKSN